MGDRVIVRHFAALLRRYCAVPHAGREADPEARRLSDRMDALLPRLQPLEYDRLRLLFLLLEEEG